MKRTILALSLTICALQVHALDGVTPYLPLNLEPEIERQIQRVLILADQPVLAKPYAAATVLDALPKACEVDAKLCEQVRRYLRRYMYRSGIGHASAEIAASSGSEVALPNRYGLSSDDSWQLAAGVYFQPNDYLFLNLSGTAYDGETQPTGSVLSMGFSIAQLDIGFREHHFSPASDSALLISTEALTIPSITLSNYKPLTRLGVKYELFAGELSHSDLIAFEGGLTSGKPRLTGLRLSIEPFSGWAVGVNRLMQYGGGARGGSSASDILKALFKPSVYDNLAPGETDVDQQFGNQLASLTSEFIFPGKYPLSIYFEYGGEDTSRRNDFLLGNTAITAGIHFARLPGNTDLTFETTEWQNGWYTNGLYGDGLSNRGHIIGHWFGDQRVKNDAVDGRSFMARVGWEPKWGGLMQLRARTIENQTYTGTPYERGYDVALSYSRQLKVFRIGAEALAGRDVLGESYSRIGTFIRYAPEGNRYRVRAAADDSAPASGTEVFVDAGVNIARVKIDLADEAPRVTTDSVGPHIGVGVRRPVSKQQDLGARLEMDDIDGKLFIGVRALDYRYRFKNSPLAAGVFIGAARYNLATPAQGMYFGLNGQWRDIVKGWDLNLDLRHAAKVARDYTQPEDPVGGVRTTSFHDISSVSLFLSRRF